ncbi:MAG: DNA replication/repair protein RecF [Sphingomonadales bacterium]|nr:DNA replication/repair protein RecF [Sphingomonadales bacterium]
MALDRILLTRFRNHRDSALSGTARFNLLVGENGAGKTNVLEAISLLAPGRGLRRAALADMALRGGEAGTGTFAISARLASGAGEPVTLGTGTEPGRPTRRLVTVNGADHPASGLGEWLSLFWLTPAMDRLFMDSPGARRRCLDRMVLALEPGHARAATRLENALRERNRLLAEARDPDPQWLDAIEGQIAEAGSLVAQARARLVERLAASLAGGADGPFAHPDLAYQPGGPLDAVALSAALRQSRPRDRAAQRTLTGPHRDELAVTMAGKDQPAAECSTGEQKAMLIALTLAHAGLAAADSTRPRLLLLDEVAAHLDPLRRAALFDKLRESGAQVWMTGTEAAPFGEILGEAAVWSVADGRVDRSGPA